MIGKKINQLATELAPTTTDLTIIGDPVTGVSKKITLEQLGAIFGGAVSFYTTLGDFPATGVIDIIYCAKDTKKLYLWSGSAYVEVFPSQSLLDTYQLRSEKGVSNGYASLDVNGKVPIGQLPNSIMEYKGTWNAATNTPTLANGTGDTGDVYICSNSGTVNFGAGPITFAVGDYVVYSGTIWQRSSGAVGTVTSVAVSRSGDALAITGSPITTSGTINLGFAGTGAQYIKGDGTLATFPSIISQAQNLVTEVYNNTGATLTKGTIVYINGGQGNLPTVTKALATGDSTSAQTYGVVQTDITNMNNGYVVVAGRLTDLDTQAYSNGTQLYLSSTTAGTWTSTKQYAPNHLVYVGIVVRSHPTQGVVEIKIQNGYEMDELHNVAAQSPSNGDILQYKTATSLWTKVAGTTSNIAEGSNLYYTDARSRAALSFTAGSGAYNSTTGVITIPTNTNQLTNGAAFITLASLSAGAGISYNNTTGVIASTITQYTDALARAAISLTTTGTSGAATYNNTTGVLNIPQYQTALTNPVTGTGTTNYLPKFTGTSTIGNSIVQDDATTVTVGGQLYVNRNDSNVIKVARNGGSNLNTVIEFANASSSVHIGSNGTLFGLGGTTGSIAAQPFIIVPSSSEKMRLDASGNLGLGVTPSAWSPTLVKAIQIGDLGTSISSYTTSNTSTPYTFVDNNAYYNGTNFIYIVNNRGAARYQQVNNEHRWEVAPSGTAGNAISFTQAMTLNASGNLSIGNTNDTYKLDVSGTGRFTGRLYADSNITFAGYIQPASNVGYGVKSANGTVLQEWYDGATYNYGSFVNSGSVTANGDIVRTSSNVGGMNEIAVINTATSGTSSSRVRISTAYNGGTTLGDALTQYTDNNNFNWATGSGVTTSRDFVITNYFTLGTSVFFRLAASTGAATFSSSVTAGGKIFTSASVNDNIIEVINSDTTNGYGLYVRGGGTASNRYVARFKNGADSDVMWIGPSNVGIGTNTNPTSTLHVTGSVAKSHTTKSANYTLTASDYTVGFDCAGGDRTANLPDATTCAGRIYVIYQYNTGGSARGVTIDGSGSQTINEATTFLLKGWCNYTSVMIQSNGSNWIVIADAIQTSCL